MCIRDRYFDISRIEEYIEKFNLQKEDVEFFGGADNKLDSCTS